MVIASIIENDTEREIVFKNWTIFMCFVEWHQFVYKTPIEGIVVNTFETNTFEEN